MTSLGIRQIYLCLIELLQNSQIDLFGMGHVLFIIRRRKPISDIQDQTVRLIIAENNPRRCVFAVDCRMNRLADFTLRQNFVDNLNRSFTFSQGVSSFSTSVKFRRMPGRRETFSIGLLTMLALGMLIT